MYHAKKLVKLLHTISITKVLVRYVRAIFMSEPCYEIVAQVETINPHDEDQFPGILQLTEEQKVI